MRRVSPLLFHQPAKVCTLLLSGFSETIVISRLLDPIGLDAEEELLAIKEEDIFVTAGRDMDTTHYSSF